MFVEVDFQMATYSLFMFVQFELRLGKVMVREVSFTWLPSFLHEEYVGGPRWQWCDHQKVTVLVGTRNLRSNEGMGDVWVGIMFCPSMGIFLWQVESQQNDNKQKLSKAM